mmetsp:Transcript_52141/g.92973  ORF Transcript_52141/g.92973 Transcript_52141/m.92973 type:complete len:262 (+) Transcript_52141:1782-2567(+)
MTRRWPSAVTCPKYSWRRFWRSRARSLSSLYRSASKTVVSCHTTACPKYMERSRIHCRSEASISVEGYTPDTVRWKMPNPNVKTISIRADSIARRNRKVLWPSDRISSLSMAPAFRSRILLVRKATIPRDMQMKTAVAAISVPDMMLRSVSLSAMDCIARLSMLLTSCSTSSRTMCESYSYFWSNSSERAKIRCSSLDNFMSLTRLLYQCSLFGNMSCCVSRSGSDSRSHCTFWTSGNMYGFRSKAHTASNMAISRISVTF